MIKRTGLLGYYNYTVILTYIGMISGFTGILKASEGRIYTAVLLLMFSGFCDMFDGAIASTMERTDDEKCFGIQIDSLSDLICFGVLPASILYFSNEKSLFILALSALYVLSALIRLSYFNVDEQNRQKATEERRKIYLGLPVTASALSIPFFYSLSHLMLWNEGVILSILIPLTAVLFLLPFELKKPGKAGKVLLLVMGAFVITLVILAGK